MKIDLSRHPNPEKFIQEVTKKYPDSNVIISLQENGNNAIIDFSEEVPSQFRIIINEFLSRKAREEVCSLIS